MSSRLQLARSDRRFLGMLLAALIVSGSIAAGTPSAPPVSPLDRVVLKASQAGRGYRMELRADSRCLRACVTLDLCGFTFASEALRTGRLQLNFIRSKRSVVISNEVVSYKDGGAAEAMLEIAHAAATCPDRPIVGPVRGEPALTYRLTRLVRGGLLPGYHAFIVRASGIVKGKRVRETTVNIYQARRNTLSAIYTAAPAGVSVAQQVEAAVHATKASGADVRRATG